MKRETEIGEILKHLLLPTTQHVQEIPFFFFFMDPHSNLYICVSHNRGLEESFLSPPLLSSRQGCHNKISQAVEFISQRNLFLIVMEIEKYKIMMPIDWVSIEGPLSLSKMATSPSCVFAWLEGTRELFRASFSN